jgi:tetratricopeptide (TPR) repeat protein
LDLDPETEAGALTVANLIAKGKNRARAGDVAGATESLQKARELNPAMSLDPQAAAARWAASALIERGGRLIEQGKANEALALYEAAQEVDPRLRVSPQSWNLLCWRGSLRGYAADIMVACEQAVKLVVEHGDFRDSRGLARALLGDYASAIEDFKFTIESMPEYEVFKHLRSKWQAWVAELEAGRNPFDSATLEVLRLSGEVFQ